MLNTKHILMIQELLDAAYESGYYSAKHEDAKEHYKQAFERRERLRRELLEMLKSHDRAQDWPEKGETCS